MKYWLGEERIDVQLVKPSKTHLRQLSYGLVRGGRIREEKKRQVKPKEDEGGEEEGVHKI